MVPQVYDRDTKDLSCADMEEVDRLLSENNKGVNQNPVTDSAPNENLNETTFPEHNIDTIVSTSGLTVKKVNPPPCTQRYNCGRKNTSYFK